MNRANRPGPLRAKPTSEPYAGTDRRPRGEQRLVAALQVREDPRALPSGVAHLWPPVGAAYGSLVGLARQGPGPFARSWRCRCHRRAGTVRRSARPCPARGNASTRCIPDRSVQCTMGWLLAMLCAGCRLPRRNRRVRDTGLRLVGRARRPCLGVSVRRSHRRSGGRAVGVRTASGETVSFRRAMSPTSPLPACTRPVAACSVSVRTATRP